MDYANLEFQTLNLQQQHQHHKCKSHKRTLFSHKEILLVFVVIGLFSNIPTTGCDDTENFQKNSKCAFSISYLQSFISPPILCHQNISSLKQVSQQQGKQATESLL